MAKGGNAVSLAGFCISDDNLQHPGKVVVLQKEPLTASVMCVLHILGGVGLWAHAHDLCCYVLSFQPRPPWYLLKQQLIASTLH